jgi:hypothetical protein
MTVKKDCFTVFARTGRKVLFTAFAMTGRKNIPKNLAQER